MQLIGDHASADHKTAETFPAELAQLIVEKWYVPEHVFNADETGQLWNKMPMRTFISKRERTALGFKAAKVWVSLLFCANAKRDCMIKQMM